MMNRDLLETCFLLLLCSYLAQAKPIAVNDLSKADVIKNLVAFFEVLKYATLCNVKNETECDFPWLDDGYDSEDEATKTFLDQFETNLIILEGVKSRLIALKHVQHRIPDHPSTQQTPRDLNQALRQ